MSSRSSVTFDSTLAYVLSYDFRVSSNTLGQSVAQTFAQNPNLPGVIVMNGTQFLGMISRVKFREQMNTPQRENLYLNSPIQVLLDYLRIPALVLDHNCKITEAVNSALKRAKELIYEPIVVVYENNIFQLVDLQVLLLAQNQLVNHAQYIIHLKQSQIEKCFQGIENEKAKLKKHEKYHEEQQKLIKNNYDDFLKIKQKEIYETAQKITEINEDFLQISRLVITELSKSFNSISASSNSIHSDRNEIHEISESISSDLESIYSACNFITKILQQIRHVAVQASIIAYQSQSTSQGFSRINVEINQLLNQILNVNQQLNKTANHFRFHAQKLKEIAENESSIARSILSQLGRAEMVVTELGTLIDKYDPNLIILMIEQAQTINPDLVPSITAKLEQLETPSEETFILESKPQHLIGLIERTLKQRNFSPPPEE